MKRKLVGAVCAALVGTGGQAAASTTTITFDEPGAIAGNAVGTFYNGLTFVDAVFQDNLGLDGSSGALGISSQSLGFNPTQADPIEVLFDTPVTSVTLRGIDVGFDGFVLRAFDSADNFLSEVAVFGTTLAGVDEFFDLTVSGSDIARIAFSQENQSQGTNDGMIFDDLTFTQIPVPAAALLFAPVIGALATRRRTS